MSTQKIELSYSNRFLTERKRYVRNNSKGFEDYSKCIKLFLANPSHPSLHIEKLSGSKLWTMRINKSDRIFFFWKDEQTALLLDIGKHDKYRKY